MKPYKIPSPTPPILFLIALIIYGLCSCNSVRKSTAVEVNKVDSSSNVKIDSSVSEKKAITVDSATLKTWDKETTIEFEKPEISKPDDTTDTVYTIYPIIGYEDGLVKVKGKIRKIVIREKSKDSTKLVKVDNSEKRIDLAKEGETTVVKKEKIKVVGKESKRSSPIIWIVIGAVLIASVIMYAIYKKVKS